MINRIILKALILSALFVQPMFLASGQTAKSAEDQSLSQASDIETLRVEVKRLAAENAKLKEENQQLRKMLVPAENTAATTPASTGQSSKNKPESSVTSTDQQETDYWLTTSSNKRHNKNCRYYKNSRGRFCKPDDGIACKVCGG